MSLGYLYLGSDAPRALHLLATADSLKPGQADALRGLGNAWYSLGDPGKAAAYWRATLRAMPSDTQTARNLAAVEALRK